MEIKRVKLTLLILASLVISSYAFFVGAQESSNASNNIFIDSDQDGLSDQEEKLYGTDPHNAETGHCGYTDGVLVRSGYDPLTCKKIIPPADSSASAPAADSSQKSASAGTNLTQQVAQKVTDLTTTNTTGDQTITMDQVQGIVDNTLNQTVSDSDLPTVSPDEIKIEKQNYSNLSKDAAAKKKKEDFANYMVAVYYILASNSPTPIKASDTVSGLTTALTTEVTNAIEQQDPSQLSDLSNYGSKVLDQLKAVEVPEDVVDIHTKALRFAKYAITLKDTLKPSADDPLADIAQYSKMESFLQELMSFSSEAQSKFDSYGIQIDDALKSKLNALGVEVPIIDTTTTDTSTTTSNSTTP